MFSLVQLFILSSLLIPSDGLAKFRILSISESRSADSYIARVGQDVKKRRADHWLSRPRICLEGCNKKESNMVNR